MTDPPAMDATAWVGPFPYRDWPESDLGAYLRLCDHEAIEFAIVSPFASLFAENNLEAFARFARSAGHRDRCEFWPVVNPAMPGQLQQVRALRDEFGFRGIRLLPMFHGYALTDAGVDPIAEWAMDRQLLVQVFHAISDERWHWMHHVSALPMLQVEYLAARHPRLRLMVCGLPRLLPIEPLLRHAKNVTADLSMIRGPEFAVESMVERLLVDRLIFGSQWPVQTLESTLWQVRHADVEKEAKASILSGHLRHLLNHAPPDGP